MQPCDTALAFTAMLSSLLLLLLLLQAPCLTGLHCKLHHKQRLRCSPAIQTCAVLFRLR